MSVEEQVEHVECPLCMEPLEMDDINFFPCTCGYQICRFCWHRIRTDENGLCPACRKQYPEDPAAFKPLTEDELQRIKKERRQKDLQRKQKAAENRKHLANVRVVQKNLVFVVGLSQRLAEPEVLKKHEYFGKFGKIHKVVINQSTSYAGAQVHGPSASAYVTYHKPEDALRAILAVNNVHIDGRTLKASLGTTKYCSHFLRGAQCPKGDCMYLHELGEEAASFTKEEMQMGKHQEYEQKLLEGFMNNQNSANNQLHVSTAKAGSSKKRNSSPLTLPQPQPTVHENGSPPHDPTPPPAPKQQQQQQTPVNSGKDAWPSLQPGGSKAESRDRTVASGNKLNSATVTNHNPRSSTPNSHSRAPGNHRHKSTANDTQHIAKDPVVNSTDTEAGRPLPPQAHSSPHSPLQGPSQTVNTHKPVPLVTAGRRSLVFDNNNTDSLSLFSGNGFPTVRTPKPLVQPPTTVPETIPNTEIPETIPVSTTTDWQAAFGFTSKPIKECQDDDLGFDPWDESSKALADLMEKENGPNLVLNHSHTGPPPQLSPHQMMQHSPRHNHGPPPLQGMPSIPPGFSLSYLNHHQNTMQHPQHPQQQAMIRPDMPGSRMMGLMNFPQPNLGSAQNIYHDRMSEKSEHKDGIHGHMQHDAFNMKDWQDGLRALLPNINISFGGPQSANSLQTPSSQHQAQTQKKSPPHWMKSIHHLTDYEGPSTNNHRLPFVQQFPFGGPAWPPQTNNPPPGFQTLRPATQPTEPHTVATESLQ